MPSATRDDIGFQAVKLLHELWMVDDDRCRWSTDGFEWWPGPFRVTVNVSDAIEYEGSIGYKLSVATDFLKGVDLGKREHAAVVALLQKIASTYAVRAEPPALAKAAGREGNGKLDLVNCIYVREDNVQWLPRFFAGLAIMQPIDVHLRAIQMRDQFGLEPNMSAPGSDGELLGLDEILEVADQIYKPAGQEVSRWIGTDEFEDVAQRLNDSGQFFANGDPEGLSFESAFLDDTALVRLHTDQKHPQLGHGLLVTLQLPVWVEDVVSTEPSAYNTLESLMFTQCPLLGSWATHEIREDTVGMSFSMFWPNALYQPGLVLNAALWMEGRVRWVKNLFFADREDQPLEETLKQRYDMIAASKVRQREQDLPVQLLRTEESPRRIIEEDFPSLAGPLPIAGGWGYTKQDACIIDRNDPTVDQDRSFDGVGLEYIFVEKRIYEELIIFRPDGQKFSGIEWKLVKQAHTQDGDRHFDHLLFEVTAFRDRDWEALKKEFQEGALKGDFDREAHERKREELKVRFEREFWFDITSFYGKL